MGLERNTPARGGGAVQLGGENSSLLTPDGSKKQAKACSPGGPIHRLGADGRVPTITLQVVKGMACVRLDPKPWGPIPNGHTFGIYKWADADQNFLLTAEGKPGRKCRAYIAALKGALEDAALRAEAKDSFAAAARHDASRRRR